MESRFRPCMSKSRECAGSGLFALAAIDRNAPVRNIWIRAAPTRQPASDQARRAEAEIAVLLEKRGLRTLLDWIRPRGIKHVGEVGLIGVARRALVLDQGAVNVRATTLRKVGQSAAFAHYRVFAALHRGRAARVASTIASSRCSAPRSSWHPGGPVLVQRGARAYTTQRHMNLLARLREEKGDAREQCAGYCSAPTHADQRTASMQILRCGKLSRPCGGHS